MMLHSPTIYRPVLHSPFDRSEEVFDPPIGHFEERIPSQYQGISPKPEFEYSSSEAK